ncbi:MAG: glycosyltransferase, partial [Nitrospirae bacterium]|nr:glycosyltransferase [Nitrospirota bacterium]
MTVSIVVPLYNEEDNVKILHEKLQESLERHKIEYEIIFVDDGSNDRTLPLLEDIQKKNKDILVLSLRRNFGQTAA